MKQDKRSNRTRIWLFETLIEIMEEKQYEQITISELTERAQISRQTFYRNFQSKDEILLFQLDEIFDEYIKTVANALEQKRDTRFLMQEFLYAWKRNEPLFLALQKANLASQTIERFSSYASVMQKTLDSDIAIKTDSQKIVFSYIAGGVFMILNKWFQENMHTPIDEVADLLDRILQFGIATIKYYNNTSQQDSLPQINQI